MATSTKISDLSTLPVALAIGDLLPMVNDPSGSPSTWKLYLSTLRSTLTSTMLAQNLTVTSLTMQGGLGGVTTFAVSTLTGYSVSVSSLMATTLAISTLGTPLAGVATNLTNKIVLGTPVDATNGGANDLTSVDFTGLPSGIKCIVVSPSDVSTNGTNAPRIQLGDAGGFETTGYTSVGTNQGASESNTSFTNGFGLAGSWDATIFLHGSAILTLVDSATFTWAYQFVGANGGAATIFNGAGSKSLSAELTQLRIIMGASEVYDNGKFNIAYFR